MNMSQFFLVMFCYDNIIIRCKMMIDLDVFMVNFSVAVDRRLLFWCDWNLAGLGQRCTSTVCSVWSSWETIGALLVTRVSPGQSHEGLFYFSTIIKLKCLFLYLWCTVSTCKYQYPSWNDWVCIYVTNIHIKYYWYVTVFLSPDFTISCWHVERISRAESEDFPPLYSVYILGLNTCWKLCWTAGD